MTPAIMAAIQAAASIGGGLLSSQGAGKETKIQKQQRHLIDELLSSLKGQGAYSGLFQNDEDAFKRSFLDPAKSMFNNQIAPQIQQNSIFGGQQRGTGLDDQLLRAGVDLDQMLNQNYLQFQNQGKDRMQNILSSILGQSPGAAPQNSTGQNLLQSAGGFLSSDKFSNMFLNNPNMQNLNANTNNQPTPRGYLPPLNSGKLPDWNIGDSRWGS